MGDSGNSEDVIPGLEGCADSIDYPTFQQILEMDDEDEEDEREFSRGIVYGFFEQAEATFDKMDARLASQDLIELSQLGHFLKGSSATLGLTQVKNSCEKIQHLGGGYDETGDHHESKEYCLEHIKSELPKVRQEYKMVEYRLRKFYGEDANPPSTT